MRFRIPAAIAIWLFIAGVAQGEDAIALRVMTFNIRYGEAADGENAWPRRRDSLLETIKGYGPDVLGTQECLAAQGDFLRKNLPGYGFVGVGREDGATKGEMCAILYRAERFHALAAGHFWLSETPDEVGSRGWDAALPRMVSWVKLRPRDGSGSPFYVFNTHFDHMGEIARCESALLLKMRASRIADELPVIVVGDFNAAADSSAPYQVLTGSAGREWPGPESRDYLDVYRALHPAGARGEKTYHGFEGGTDGERIDWILVSPGIRPLESEIVHNRPGGRWPSDHYPVTAIVRIPA
jgi:endonuclease/exonuclease/phosphatase family metal-dependent hydrolase